MLALLAIGGVLFWILTVIVFIVLAITFENEHYGVVGLVTIAWLAYFWLGPHGVGVFVVHNVGTTLLYVLYYVITGIVWGAIKWFIYLHETKDKYYEMKQEYLTKQNVRDIAHLTEYQTDNLYAQISKLELMRAKGRITGWSTFWPISITVTLLRDPIKALTRKLRRLYDWMESQVLGDVRNEIAQAKAHK